MAKKADPKAVYLKHAGYYGAEGVMEAAKDDPALSFDQLVELQEALDVVWKQRLRHSYVKPRKSAHDRVNALLGLNEEETA